MRVSDGLAAAFIGSPPDPDDGVGLPRFLCQTYWLGKCAEIVYPPKIVKGSPQSHRDEVEFDRQAEVAKRAYRKLRPSWKVFFKKTAEQEQAEDHWHAAEAKWARTARARIEAEVRSFWVAAGDPAPVDLRVEFYSRVGTQYFVARDEKTVIVCFRGTEPKKRSDLFADILSIQASDEKVHNGKIHLGFWTALDHVWNGDDVRPSGELLPRLLSKASLMDNHQTVWFTGHSLGGALATLAADRLLVGEVLTKAEVGGVFTFGQPRVGDKVFAERYELKDRHFRFINNNDAVTKVPPKSLWLVSLLFGKLFKRASKEEGTGTHGTLSFRHVGRVVFANRSGAIKLLKPGFFRWRIQLFFGRMLSRMKAPVKLSGIMPRFFPGLADHSMLNYNSAIGGSQGAAGGEDRPQDAV